MKRGERGVYVVDVVDRMMHETSLSERVPSYCSEEGTLE